MSNHKFKKPKNKRGLGKNHSVNKKKSAKERKKYQASKHKQRVQNSHFKKIKSAWNNFWTGEIKDFNEAKKTKEKS